MLRIVEDARDVLRKCGFALNHEEAVEQLADCGARIEKQRVFLTDDIIDSALQIAPSSVELFNHLGVRTHRMQGNRVHFTPGSAALNIIDPGSTQLRPATSSDYIRYAKLVDHLPAFAAQSTAIVPSDVPVEISDSFRLYLSLIYGKKPVVTGTFHPRSFSVMKDLQLIVRGDGDELIRKPLTIFTCCSASPLKWDADSVQTLFDCSRSGIPVEIVPAPLLGFISPVTLVGALVQHTAENLSGIVLSQIARPGSPVVFGGAPSFFDIRYETTPSAIPETNLLECAYNEIGKYLSLPTQAYIAVSDSKTFDGQAGMETSMGATLAVLSGINSVAGPGLLEYLNSFSLEKLLFDHEVCQLAMRLAEGIEEKEDLSASPLIDEMIYEGHCLITDHTRKFRQESYVVPSPLIDRTDRDRWVANGRPSLLDRARREVEQLVGHPEPVELDNPILAALSERMLGEAERYGLTQLPDGLE